MNKMLALLLLMPMLAMAQEDERLEKSPIIGDFKVVTIRNASDVSVIRMPEEIGGEEIGNVITFTEEGIEIEGMSCDAWAVFQSLVPVVNTNDPILSDIHVSPADSPLSKGDQRIGKTFHYVCEDESFMHVYQVDDRVLVIPWGNSAQYLIAERDLSKVQITAMQAQLRNHKFLEGDLTGYLDNKTVGAVSAWSHYRLASEDGYVFKRAAITENLLDTFGIFDN